MTTINPDQILEAAQRIKHKRDFMGVKDRDIPVTVCDIDKLVELLDLNKSLTTDMMVKMEVIQ